MPARVAQVGASKGPFYASYVSFTELGGPTATFSDIELALRDLPLDGVLGYLGQLSMHAFRNYDDFYHPRFQGYYLSLAIEDDFPVRLRDAAKMIVPGRVPLTGGRYILVHEHNLCLLSHMALITCQPNTVTPELSRALRRRVCRLLLMTNDLCSEDTRHIGVPTTLEKGQAFAASYLRRYLFNSSVVKMPMFMHAIERQRLLFVDLLPPHYAGADATFHEATGLTVQEYLPPAGAVFVASVSVNRDPTIAGWLPRQSPPVPR